MPSVVRLRPMGSVKANEGVRGNVLVVLGPATRYNF